MQREFGHRPSGRVTRESLRDLQGAYGNEYEPDEVRASKLRRILFFAGAAALLVGIYFGTKVSGQQLSQYWNKNSGPVIPQAYVAVGVKDVGLEQINNTCRGRGDAVGSGNTLREAAVYVACLSTENPKRFCQATHRTHFLAAVTNYYRLLSKNRDARGYAQVTEALVAVVRGGTIPRRDVLAAGNADLEAALAGVQPAQSGC